MGYQNTQYAGRYNRPDDGLGLAPGAIFSWATGGFGPTKEFLDREGRRIQFMDWLNAWRQVAAIAPQWKADLYKPILDQAKLMVDAGEHSHEPSVSWMFSKDIELNKIERMDLPDEFTTAANQRPTYPLAKAEAGLLPADMSGWLPIVATAAGLIFMFVKKG